MSKNENLRNNMKMDYNDFTCSQCRFCQHHDTKSDFVCHNENAMKFGSSLTFEDMDNQACKNAIKQIYSTMTMQEALDVLTSREGMLNTVFKHRSSENMGSPSVTITFPSNAELETCRDASNRSFNEWVKYAMGNK